MPRVLHVSLSDIEGGAARAAYRLHRGLLKIGVDSQMVVVRRRSHDPTVKAPLGRVGLHANRVAQRLSQGVLSLQSSSNPVLRSLNWCPSGLGRWLRGQQGALVHLHWVGGETLSLHEIAGLGQPVIWTLHDMWPFCGAEHYDNFLHPGRYRHGYSAESRPPGEHGPDLDRYSYVRKRKTWRGRIFHLACPSQWMADRVAESDLLGHMPVRVIPNGVDVEVFRPFERNIARHGLGLPDDDKLILFGAVASTSDTRKGFDLLIDSLHMLAAQRRDRQPVRLLVFGAADPVSGFDGTPCLQIHYMGSVEDEARLALIYSAADVFVAPSRQDNLPNTLIEAQACGVPSVAFRVGGIPEAISDGESGFLVEPFSTRQLAEAISRVLDVPPEQAREKSRRFAAGRFSDLAMAAKYADYYRSISRQLD